MKGIDVEFYITESRNSTSESYQSMWYILHTPMTLITILTRLNFHIAMDYIIKEFIRKV